LSLAADLITQPGATVTSVAARVGYATPFALSTAFKRRYGLSPHEHRMAVQQSLCPPVESVEA
jgi:AraC-like DNA-binding protein